MSRLEELTTEAVRLIDDAAGEGMVLRALGSVGVQLHCPEASREMESRERVPKDIDLVTRRRDRRHIRRFFEDRSYRADRDVLVAMEGTRYLFRHGERDIDVDIWVEELDLCHRLVVGERLGDGPALTIEDLILSKLQIVELTAHDRRDLAAMFASHEVGDAGGDPEIIDAGYVAGILSEDWGFWRTATANLAAVGAEMGSPGRERAEQLLREIQETPKSLRWRARARVGERVRWWQEVDLPRDTY